MVTGPGGGRPLAGQQANEGCEEGGGPAIGGGARRAGAGSRAGHEPGVGNVTAFPPPLPPCSGPRNHRLAPGSAGGGGGGGVRAEGAGPRRSPSPPYPRSCA